jgi:hypothetical protein
MYQKFDEANMPVGSKLEHLAFLLRHKELWPKTFEWSYSSCQHCAIGLGFEMMGIEGFPLYHKARDFFGLPEADSAYIFKTFCLDLPGGGTQVLPTEPHNIADRIDEVLAKQKENAPVA